jgi:hypothetical protein
MLVVLKVSGFGPLGHRYAEPVTREPLSVSSGNVWYLHCNMHKLLEILNKNITP